MSAREVELTGGAPWGFRMHGGVDQNQPLRISRVNPGRKASLSGIREGDVISSINGRPTKGLSNADAHAMLRTAGPVLRLGLNEDREMSPRRRSFGKTTELKRPSQLVAEVQKATPQAPVYATIRPSRSPQSRQSTAPLRSSLNSLPSALSSTPLVKSVVEDPPKFHPTNPFYSTLSSNHTSASKLPVPNGRPSFASIDRTKKESNNESYSAELKSPSFFKKYDSSSSLSYLHHNENVNGFDSATKYTANDTTDPFSYDKSNQYGNQGVPKNDKNPFEAKRNSDPFEKYFKTENNINGNNEFGTKIPGSQSDSNFNRREEITKKCTITEEKISEIEEVKTIKKIVLNGSGDDTERTNWHKTKSSPLRNVNRFDSSPQKSRFEEYSCYSGEDQTMRTPQNQSKDYWSDFRTDHLRYTPSSEQKSEYYSSVDKREEIRNFCSPSSSYHTAEEFKSPTADPSETTGKPPLKPEAAQAPTSPSKRK